MKDLQLPLLTALIPKAIVALLLSRHVVVELFPLEAQGRTLTLWTVGTFCFLHCISSLTPTECFGLLLLFDFWLCTTGDLAYRHKWDELSYLTARRLQCICISDGDLERGETLNLSAGSEGKSESRPETHDCSRLTSVRVED